MNQVKYWITGKCDCCGKIQRNCVILTMGFLCIACLEDKAKTDVKPSDKAKVLQ
jgi:hypothetical protein